MGGRRWCGPEEGPGPGPAWGSARWLAQMPSLLVPRGSSLLLHGHDFFVLLSSALWSDEGHREALKEEERKSKEKHIFWPELHQIIDGEYVLLGEGKSSGLRVLFFLDNKGEARKHGGLDAGHVRSLQHPALRDWLGWPRGEFLVNFSLSYTNSEGSVAGVGGAGEGGRRFLLALCRSLSPSNLLSSLNNYPSPS